MDSFEVALGALRGLMFIVAVFSATIFVGEVDVGWQIICATFSGKVRGQHLVGLAALGWFFCALAVILFSAHRLISLIWEHQVYQSRFHSTTDGMFVLSGMLVLALGFYLPVLSLLWYRKKQALAVGFGAAAVCFSLYCGYLTSLYMPISLTVPIHSPQPTTH